MPKLSIIIVNWNTAKLLTQCLNSLEIKIQNSKFKIEVIVVDNGSTDGSVTELQSFKVSKLQKIDLKIIENKENLGFAKGNNIGIKQSKGEYIMLLNSDTIIKEGAIEKLVEFLEKRKDYASVGPKLLNQDGSVQSSCGRFPDLWVSFIMLFKEHFGGSKSVRFSPEKSSEVDWLMGSAFITRREVFEKIGGLDERIFMYMEEVEWFYRCHKAGLKSYFLKEAEIIHLGRGSSNSGKKEPIINIYKGLIHFYKIHKSPLEQKMLKLMLKTKAGISYLLGVMKRDQYLKETYGQAYKII